MGLLTQKFRRVSITLVLVVVFFISLSQCADEKRNDLIVDNLEVILGPKHDFTQNFKKEKVRLNELN